jgi:opacity protein-like surface antigen
MVRLGWIALAAVAVCSMASTLPRAHAQLYIAGSLGGEFVSDADLRTTTTNAVTALTFDLGAGGNAALGYAFGALRVEGEAFYRYASLDQATVAGVVQIADGNQSSYGAMVNLWYDFYTGSGWIPFVGGGIGYANVNLTIDSFTLGTVVTPQTFDQSDWVLAYQFGAGFGYQFGPRTTATFAYRYFMTDDPEWTQNGAPQSYEYASHNFQIGIRYRF